MRRWFFAAAAAAGAAVSITRADSIWDRNDPRYGFLFQDMRARRVGDVLTVIVSETTVASEQDQRNLSRSTSGSGTVQFFGSAPTTSGASTGTGPSIPGTAVGLPAETTSRLFGGTAQLTTNRVFTDRMGVVVVDLLANGNLVVEGYRSRVVQGEERVLRITGIVRPADIGVGNVVSSGSVANFRISYLGRGPATRMTRQGPFGRLANLLWPF